VDDGYKHESPNLLREDSNDPHPALLTPDRHSESSNAKLDQLLDINISKDDIAYDLGQGRDSTSDRKR
jgi:hypothetical protein